MSTIFDWVVRYLTADFPLAAENQAFWMALQGCMACRNGRNFSKNMHWFHAFALSLVSGYGGSLLAPLWMGNPTSILSNDLSMAAVIIAFVFVNFLPFDLGMKIGNFYPVCLVTVTFSQLFRTTGVVRYVDIAFNAFKDKPSAYYPVPVFGPILFATILGNMSSFFIKGFDGHLQNGVPWPFQNGFFCATFYYFFVYDDKGIIGIALKDAIHSLPSWVTMGLDDQRFAMVMISAFMQINGMLQMPQHIGPSFTPFVAIPTFLSDVVRFTTSSLYRPTKAPPEGSATPYASPTTSYQASVNANENGPVTDLTSTSKRRRNRKRNKAKTS